MSLRSTQYHASAAYLSSVLSCRSLIAEVTPELEITVETNEALDHFNMVLGSQDGEEIPEVVAMGLAQKHMSNMVDNAMNHSLLELADSTRNKARLSSVALQTCHSLFSITPLNKFIRGVIGG